MRLWLVPLPALIGVILFHSVKAEKSWGAIGFQGLVAYFIAQYIMLMTEQLLLKLAPDSVLRVGEVAEAPKALRRPRIEDAASALQALGFVEIGVKSERVPIMGSSCTREFYCDAHPAYATLMSIARSPMVSFLTRFSSGRLLFCSTSAFRSRGDVVNRRLGESLEERFEIHKKMAADDFPGDAPECAGTMAERIELTRQWYRSMAYRAPWRRAKEGADS